MNDAPWNDPKIQSIVNMFGGRVVKVEPIQPKIHIDTHKEERKDNEYIEYNEEDNE